jgi:hypothetical protein
VELWNCLHMCVYVCMYARICMHIGTRGLVLQGNAPLVEIFRRLLQTGGHVGMGLTS